MSIYVCAWCGATKDEAHSPACTFAETPYKEMIKHADYLCGACGAKGSEPRKDTCRYAPVSPDLKDADSYQIGGDHYKEMAVQPWKAMQSWMTESEFEGFLRGNAIKYLARAGRKDDDLQDLKKALHYLEKLVSVKEKGE